MTTTALDRAIAQVTLNPRYAVPLRDGQVAATYVPGGFWAVKLRPRGGQWIAFVVPRHTTPGDPFLLAVGEDVDQVRSAAIRWRDQAATLTCRLDRMVFAGTGNATHERLNTDDLDSRWAVLDTQERR